MTRSQKIAQQITTHLSSLAQQKLVTVNGISKEVFDLAVKDLSAFFMPEIAIIVANNFANEAYDIAHSNSEQDMIDQQFETLIECITRINKR